jgi:glycosyltransferase involved in cell wall biosynthesis
LFVGFRRKPGIAYARKAGIPCVGFYRTNFIEYIEDYFPLPPIVATGVKSAFKAFLRWVYNSYDATLIHSQIIHQKLVEIGINNTIFENLNGYDADKFYPGLKQTNFFATHYNQPQIDEQVKLVFLGRLTVDKGWNFTIKAFEQIAKTIDLTKVAILIAGDGDMRQEIATGLGKYTNNVHFLGRISPDGVAALLANSNIFVTTSEKENRALTVIEALAVGLPILAPRAGGIPQDVEDGWNGYLFEPQNQAEFVQKLKKLVEDTDLRQQMGKKSYEYVKKYSWDNTIANMVKIWQTQIDRKNP